MNIELQSCGLAMLSVFSVFIARDKKLELKNHKLFVGAYICCFICLIFDILSIICIFCSANYGFPEIATKTVCKLYIMSLVLQGYQGFLYACFDTAREKKYRLLRIICRLIFLIGEILIVLLPISYYIDGRVVYSYGPAPLCTYALALYFIIITISFTIINKEKLSGRRITALITWHAAALIQFFNKELLVVSFASVFGMLVLYALLENPNEHIDRITGLFTQNALMLYLQDRYKYNEPFSMFTAKIKYLVPFTELDMRKDALLRSTKEFNKLNSNLIFVLGDDMFCVIYDSAEQAYSDLISIKKLADGVRDVPAEARFIYFPDSKQFSNSDEVMKFIRAHENEAEEIVECTEELVQNLRNKQNMYNLIENALKEDRVVVYYQPIYDVKEGRFTTAEALVRIINTDGSLVPPGDFIPMAEENGQIIPLGIRIFEKVCQFLSTKKPQKLGIERIEINVSVAQFDHENPAGFIQEHLDYYGVDPKSINLEITETASNDLKHILLMNMDRLLGQGISFSLDDFGTGRSNFDYFVDMPVENIKFDYTFTQGYFSNERTRHILEGMVDIMHNMGMKIVSEGVETKEQFDTMVKMGVDYIQGYYFSKPIPGDKLLEFLESRVL